MKKLIEMSVEDLKKLTAEELRNLIAANVPQINRRISQLEKAQYRGDIYRSALEYQRKVAFAFGNGKNPDMAKKTAEKYSMPDQTWSRNKSFAVANAIRAGLQARTSTIKGIERSERQRKNTFEAKMGIRKGGLTWAEYRDITDALSQVQTAGYDSSTVFDLFQEEFSKSKSKRSFRKAQDILDFISTVENATSEAEPAMAAYERHSNTDYVWDTAAHKWVLG